ncbi:hypothetical protein Msi02_62320 [Microbispora siamensis]|uniref:Uncharacterized protein n=1 Tax=Microbispora siamensis TaxID=564413 RepID=A0ABQ4GVI8_9ACTN|nr:hypothetical protein Msi02_62320 [Microbispora siamensis]
MRPELPAAGTGPQAACPAAERATGREAARSAALDSYKRNSAGRHSAELFTALPKTVCRLLAPKIVGGGKLVFHSKFRVKSLDSVQ